MNGTRVLFVLALVLFPLDALADGISREVREVTVTGRAEIRIAPDQVVLDLAVETMKEVLELSKQENDRIANAALDAVRGIGLGADLVKTGTMQIEPVYLNTRTEMQFLGYRVTKSIMLTLEDIDLFEELLSAVLGAGVNRVSGIEFRSTGYRQHRDRAMLLALDAAKEKAEAMSKRLGSKLGKPVSIQEGVSSYRPLVLNNSQSASKAGNWLEGPLQPGQLSIPATVTVSFELVD